ncbi:MAG: amidohydrolase [Halieaceae bacterium]|nr:amidohydrolase [Halieaceae bacterium]
MQDLKVALAQTTLHWEAPEANREAFADRLQALQPDTDLVVLPEMFCTGFSMNAEAIAEDDAQDTLPWLKALAARYDVAITGSLAVREAGRCYNRLLFVTPDGEHASYDKRHLFTLSGEQHHYAAGTRRLVLHWRGWRICPMVCYDLRFPVWMRNRDGEHPDAYDLLLVVANWPAKRRVHWRQLLVARAIENQACCIGVNRVGRDGNELDYSGDSLAIAADGRLILDCEDKDGLQYATLEAEPLLRYREKFRALGDADAFSLDLQ